jgi:hypothetical protein
VRFFSCTQLQRKYKQRVYILFLKTTYKQTNNRSGDKGALNVDEILKQIMKLIIPTNNATFIMNKITGKGWEQRVAQWGTYSFVTGMTANRVGIWGSR